MKLNLIATSLIETLIASVISSICFGVGLMIYTNVLKASFNNLQAEAKLYIEQDIQLSEEQNKFKSEDLILENVVIEKKVSFYQGKEDLIQISYIALDSKGKQIIEHNILKYIEK